MSARRGSGAPAPALGSRATPGLPPACSCPTRLATGRAVSRPAFQGVADSAIDVAAEAAVDASRFPQEGEGVMRAIYTKTFPALQKVEGVVGG